MLLSILGCVMCEFDSFSYTGNYVGTGLFYSKATFVNPPFPLPTTFGTQNATIVFDGNRSFLDLGTGGKFWYFADKTFVVGVNTLNGACGQVMNYNYSNVVRDYGKAFSIDKKNKTYIGTTNGTCQFALGLGFELRFTDNEGYCEDDEEFNVQGNPVKVIKKFAFQQNFPVAASPQLPLNLCINAQGIFTIKKKGINFSQDRNPFFVLPPECNNPVDYCLNAYRFQNNGCGF